MRLFKGLKKSQAPPRERHIRHNCGPDQWPIVYNLCGRLAIIVILGFSGDGTHKLPVKAELRRAIGKDAGDTVVVRIDERLGA